MVKVLVASLGSVVLCGGARAGEPKTDNKLVGTWKLAFAKYGGAESKLPQEYTALKHATPSQFM